MAVLAMTLLVMLGCSSQRQVEVEASTDAGIPTPVHSTRLFLARHTPVQGWILVNETVVGPGP
jgi:hypothetical protein